MPIVLERSFQVSAASFFQVNTQMAASMVEFILDNLPLESSSTLVELYSGVGLFSAFLAPHVNRLVAIESNSEASEDFVVNLDEFDNVELFEAPVEIALPELQIKADIILVDPPRSGLPRQVIESRFDRPLAVSQRARFNSAHGSTHGNGVAELVSNHGHCARQDHAES